MLPDTVSVAVALFRTSGISAFVVLSVLQRGPNSLSLLVLKEVSKVTHQLKLSLVCFEEIWPQATPGSFRYAHVVIHLLRKRRFDWLAPMLQTAISAGTAPASPQLLCLVWGGRGSTYAALTLNSFRSPPPHARARRQEQATNDGAFLSS